MRPPSPSPSQRNEPRWLRAIVRFCLPEDDREHMLDSLHTLFERRATTDGRSSAVRWYARQAAGFLLRLGAGRVAHAVAGSDSIRTDARVALRVFRKRPAFPITFAFTLAIATGVLSTVYATARWVLLRDVPGVAHPEELALLHLRMKGAPPQVNFRISEPDAAILRERLPVQRNLATLTRIEVDLSGDSLSPRRVAGEMVSSNYFAVLGVRLAAGRVFRSDEDAPGGADPSIVVSHTLAATIVADANLAVGRLVRLNGRPVRIIGVLAEGFRGAELPGRSDVWTTAAARQVIDPSTSADAYRARGEEMWRSSIVRLPSDISVPALQLRANHVISQIRSEFARHSFPANDQEFHAFAGIGLDPSVRESVKKTLGLLGVASVFLLLLAIANLTNLALIRATTYRSATAVRVALGASRARIVRAVAVEAGILGTAGGIGAVALALVWSRWFQTAQLSEYGAPLSGLRPDWSSVALAYTVAVAGSSLAFLKTATGSINERTELELRRNNNASPGSQRFRTTLVSAQVALSLMLLVSAGLLARTVSNLRNIDIGFDPSRILTVALDPHLHGLESKRLMTFGLDLEMRLANSPGVAAAGFISPTPFSSGYITAALYGSSDPDARPTVGAGYFVTPGALKALGVRFIAGDHNWRAEIGTAVISRTAVSMAFPNLSPESVIGRVVPTARKGAAPVRIAAVIEDIKLTDITRDSPAVIFRPLAERWDGISLTALVAAHGNPAQISANVRSIMAQAAPEIPMFDFRSARAAVDLQFAERDTMARVAMTLGFIGLLLAATGLYGVVASVVAGRKREFGIRSALGASPAELSMRVLRGGLTPVAAGAIAGLAGGIMMAKVLSSQLYQLASLDRMAFGGAILGLVVSALLACLVPAIQASRTAPAEVLRDD